MIPPLQAMSGALLLVLLLVVIFWPVHGLYPRWERLLSKNHRSLLEDALKHMYECERSQITCTLNSLAGTLFIKKDQALRILNQLEKSGLVHLRSINLNLTSKGKAEAIRLVRLHRILESYLANETGADEREWHSLADNQEHQVNSETIESMNERLGHPRYDPHGEPIPTAEGEVLEDRGILISEQHADHYSRIIQFEDDPEQLYHEIREAGLCLGMQIDSVRRENGTLTFNADGVKKKLPLITAAHIRVEPISEEEILPASFTSLLDLVSGERARVLKISRELHGQNRRRLLDLGIVPGSVITKEMESASGNPIAYRVKGALIALRKNQARCVYVESLGAQS